MVIPIIDGPLNHGTTFAEHVRVFVGAFAARLGIVVPPLQQVSDTPPLDARIDAGRWIVECPDCHDAQFIWPAEPAPIFMCVTCFNVAVGGDWRLVAVPPNRAALERLLLFRPLPHNRNWRAGETVDTLRAENIAHGVEV